MNKLENKFENIDSKFMRSVGSQDQPLVLQGSTIYTKVGALLKPIAGSGSETVTVKWGDDGTTVTIRWMPASITIKALSRATYEFKFIKQRYKYPSNTESGWFLTNVENY